MMKPRKEKPRNYSSKASEERILKAPKPKKLETPQSRKPRVQKVKTQVKPKIVDVGRDSLRLHVDASGRKTIKKKKSSESARDKTFKNLVATSKERGIGIKKNGSYKKPEKIVPKKINLEESLFGVRLILDKENVLPISAITQEDLSAIVESYKEKGIDVQIRGGSVPGYKSEMLRNAMFNAIDAEMNGLPKSANKFRKQAETIIEEMIAQDERWTLPKDKKAVEYVRQIMEDVAVEHYHKLLKEYRVFVKTGKTITESKVKAHSVKMAARLAANAVLLESSGSKVEEVMINNRKVPVVAWEPKKG